MDLFAYSNQITETENKRLTELEHVIDGGLKTFVDVGMALLEIRDSRLYRKDYGTFEEYCRDRWGMERRRTYQIMDAAKVVGNVNLGTQIAPANERQARPIASLPPEVQPVAWQRAIDTAPDGRVTAAHVQSVVDTFKPEVARAKQAMEITTYSHNSLEYYTPVYILEAARDLMGGIDLDPASCDEAQVNVRAKEYYTQETDGLSRVWYGRVWLNPPYSKTNGRSNQDIWSQKLLAEYKVGNVTEALLLVKAALGYKWFEELFDILPVCLVRERLSFILESGDDDGQSKQGTAIFYLGDDYMKFAQVFGKYGRIIPGKEVLDAAMHKYYSG